MMRFLSAFLLLLLLLPAVANAKSKAKTKPGSESAETPAAAPTTPAATSTEAATKSEDAASAKSAPSAVSSTGAATGAAAPSATDANKPSSLPKHGKDEVDAAKAQASSRFWSGRFVEAADLLMRVYQADPQPLYLFNADQAYRKGDRPRLAKGACERFLQAAPEHKLVPEVRGYVRIWHEQRQHRQEREPLAALHRAE